MIAPIYRYFQKCKRLTYGAPFDLECRKNLGFKIVEYNPKFI
jgi:hypothetical protein